MQSLSASYSHVVWKFRVPDSIFGSDLGFFGFRPTLSVFFEKIWSELKNRFPTFFNNTKILPETGVYGIVRPRQPCVIFFLKMLKFVFFWNFENFRSQTQLWSRFGIFQNSVNFERFFFENMKKSQKFVSYIFLYLSKAAGNRCLRGRPTTLTPRDILSKVVENRIFLILAFWVSDPAAWWFCSSSTFCFSPKMVDMIFFRKNIFSIF